MAHLLDLRREQVALLALWRSAADLAHQLVQLLLVKNALALALQLEGGRLRQRRLIHNAAANTAAAAVRGATAADASDVRRSSRHLSRFLGENLGNRQLRLQVLRRGRVRVGMALLLLLCAHHAHVRGRRDAGPGGRG